MLLRSCALAIAIASVAALAFARTSSPATPSAPAKAIGALDWLVDGTWVAKPNQPNLREIQTTYSWSTTHSFIRFTTIFVLPSGPENHYDGLLYYDPDAGRLAMLYVDNAFAVMHGPMQYDGTKLSMWFSSVGDRGERDDYRVDMTRQGVNQYYWQVSQENAGVWKPLFGLTFVRLLVLQHTTSDTGSKRLTGVRIGKQ